MGKISFIRGFVAIMMACLAVLTLMTGCESDPIINNQTGIDINGGGSTKQEITDASNKDCRHIADSAVKVSFKDGLLDLSEESIQQLTAKLYFGENSKDSIKKYSAVNGISMAYPAVKLEKAGDIKSLENSKIIMKEDKFVVAQTTMSVSIRETTVDKVSFGKFEFSKDNEHHELRLCYPTIIGGYMRFGTAAAVEGSKVAFTLPVEIGFPKSEGDTLKYKGVIAASANAEDLVIIGDPRFDGEGNAEFDIISNKPYTYKENVAVMVADQIQTVISKDLTIALASAKEIAYSEAKKYPFDFSKFVAQFFTSYKSSVTIVVDGKSYVKDLPKGTVKLISISDPISSNNQATYTITAGLFANNANNDLIVKAAATAVIMTSGDDPNPDNYTIITTDNGDNTGTIDLKKNNTTVKKWTVPLGLNISTSEKKTLSNENLNLSLTSSTPGTWSSTTESGYSNDGVTAEMMSRNDIFKFNLFEENAVIKAYRNFKVKYDGHEFNADFNTAVNSSVALQKGDYANNNGKETQKWNLAYKASNGKSAATCNQLVIIEKGSQQNQRYNVIITDNGDNTGKIELTDKNNNVVKSYTVNLGLQVEVINPRSFTNENLNLSLLSSTPGAAWGTSGETYTSPDGVKADKMFRTDVYKFSHYTENAKVYAHKNFRFTFENEEYTADFNESVNSSVNIRKGDYTEINNETSQQYNNVYAVSNGKSIATADQLVTIEFEKKDVITDWEFIRDELNRRGNDFISTIFGKEIHSIPENNKDTEISQSRNLAIANSGDIVITSEINGSLKSDNTTSSTINAGDFTGRRQNRSLVYNVGNQTATLTIAADVILSYKGHTLKEVDIQNASVTYQDNQTSSSKSGIVTTVIYNRVYTIVINGETFTSNQKITRYEVEYTIPGWILNPKKVTMACRSKVYTGDRNNPVLADVMEFMKEDNNAETMVVGFQAGTTTILAQSTNFNQPTHGQYYSLVINSSNAWEVAELYGTNGGNLSDQKKGHLSGYEYSSLISDAYNSFGPGTTGGLEKYGHPVIGIMSYDATTGIGKIMGTYYK